MQRSLVAEDLSNGAEAFKLRVVNQYNDDEEVTPPGFEYITAVEKKEVPMAMSPKSGEGEQQPKLGPYKVWWGGGLMPPILKNGSKQKLHQDRNE